MVRDVHLSPSKLTGYSWDQTVIPSFTESPSPSRALAAQPPEDSDQRLWILYGGAPAEVTRSARHSHDSHPDPCATAHSHGHCATQPCGHLARHLDLRPHTVRSGHRKGPEGSAC